MIGIYARCRAGSTTLLNQSARVQAFGIVNASEARQSGDMARLFVFGMGYTTSRLADHLREAGWAVVGTSRAGEIAFDDRDRVISELAAATHILSSVPPIDNDDPVLGSYGEVLKTTSARWVGYLSSTGVYGDTRGAWIDESAPVGLGRRSARAKADLSWQGLRGDVWIFRLPGIYGPGRSPLERVAAGGAYRIDMPGQVFSRIHVDDIVRGVVKGFDGPPGVYNLADDEPASQSDVMAYAAQLIGVDPPPLLTPEKASLSPAARAFYAENRRAANGKAKRLLGWVPRYATYREGLRALRAMMSPTTVSEAPNIAAADQR
jgi:nucleoside-diphosphate-sugar epimerase